MAEEFINNIRKTLMKSGRNKSKKSKNESEAVLNKMVEYNLNIHEKLKYCKAVIFDLDNTLLEFVEAKRMACRAIIDYIGAGNEDELMNFFIKGPYGYEDVRNIADYLKTLNIFGVKTFQKCCSIYRMTKIENIRAYNGTEAVLKELKAAGLKLGIVTDALNGNAFERLEKLGLSKYFDVVVTSDMTGKKKPDPEPIMLAINSLGVVPEQAIMVGDSLGRDIEAGNRLGMITVHALYGDKNYFEDGTGRADFIIKDIKVLSELIL